MIVALILPLFAQAAEAPVPGWSCDDPIMQQEMNWCAARDFEVADERLNAQWPITAAAMKARDAAFLAHGAGERDTREGYFESLLESQRGWLRYRDAHCRVEGYYARGGSLEPLLISTCKARLTRMRTDQLRELVETPG